MNQFTPQSRPQSPPDSLSASRLLPCRNIRLGIYKLTLGPPNRFSSGSFLLLLLLPPLRLFFSFSLLFIVHRPRIVTTTIDSLYALPPLLPPSS